MKFRNYKSAVHNFAHSFQSIDYTKSGRLAINVLIYLNRLEMIPLASFDFINKTITPKEAITKESSKLLNDYLTWLPLHFRNHNCDIKNLEKLIITISIDLEHTTIPRGMNKCQLLTIKTRTNWKSFNKDEEIIDISLDEIVDNYYLKVGLPES